MNVSGIRPYEGFYKYNSQKIKYLCNLQMEEARKLQEPLPAEEHPEVSLEDAPVGIPAVREDMVSRPNFDAYDYAQGYQPDVSYSLKGADSDISNLDVEKALSNLRKDKVLQQYQFFVGERKQENLLAAPRSAENFFL